MCYSCPLPLVANYLPLAQFRALLAAAATSAASRTSARKSPSQLRGLGPKCSGGGHRSAGIVVDGNSEAYLRGGQITMNQGPAMLVLVNSSADFTGGGKPAMPNGVS